MKKILWTVLFCACLIMPTGIFAADSLTDELLHIPNTDIYILEITWDCGTGSATFSEDLDTPIQGYILAIETWPTATAPTNDSDLVLNTTHSTTKADILGGDGTDIIDNATDNYVVMDPPIPYEGILTAVITGNIVEDADGKIRLYIRRNP